ncbi:MAG: helix-turn-helix transcriptional regulator [Candidatus Omnitrophica bacterium]|nr:helix-turn-helix transcriptional regulator [Candidatus Omnitrophota bacterium]
MVKAFKRKKICINFGEIVRAKRHKLGLSQEAFAEHADLHRTYISDIELGKVDVGISVAQKVAKALKTPLSKLIKDIESK